MKPLLIVAMILCSLHVLADIVCVSFGEETNLLLDAFYDIVFIITYCNIA